MKNIIKLCDNITWQVLSAENSDSFFEGKEWLDQKRFLEICGRYGYPDSCLTVIVENYYIDAAYRDVYYSYWARFHFDWSRHCKRLFLFLNRHEPVAFFDKCAEPDLQKDFLGTIIVRPAYSKETDHTFGKTLLNPYKMTVSDDRANNIRPFVYMATTEYMVHLLGNMYKVYAFPFLSQDGVAMKCAETAIYILCDYASMISPSYARVLPSMIHNKLRERLPERVLPSHGLYCNDISYLLREFGFSPLIYSSSDNIEQIQEGVRDIRVGEVSQGEEDENLAAWDNEHTTDYKAWLHYYVESAIPILSIISPSQEVNKHATLIVGHGRKRKAIEDCKVFKLGDFPCIDTAELYDSYIVQDDNQVPYVEEKMDRFTQKQSYKLEAYIVPLDRHVFLEAGSAVNICDTFIEFQKERFQEAIEYIMELSSAMLKVDDENKEGFSSLISAMEVSEDNPITIRYFLANSAELKQDRIKNTENINEKKFYGSILMPKLVWISEISTYKSYEMGYVFGEIILDATATNKSKINSVISLRTAHMGAYRLPNETYSAFEQKIRNNLQCADLDMMFIPFSCFKNEQWEWNSDNNNN